MQTILVFVFIAGAIFYLARQLYVRFFKKETHCDQCAFGAMDKKNSNIGI